MKPGLVHTLVFRLGLLGFLFFVWGYFYSLVLEHGTAVTARNASGERCSVGLVYARLYLTCEETGPLLPSGPRSWSIDRDRYSDVFWGLPAFLFGEGFYVPPRKWYVIPLWLPWLVYSVGWMALLAWRRRRLK